MGDSIFFSGPLSFGFCVSFVGSCLPSLFLLLPSGARWSF